MNIAEILKYCPKGTKLYSTVYGEVKFDKIDKDIIYINVPYIITLFSDGKYKKEGECLLFPSKDQRDWSKFRLPVKRGDIMMSIDESYPFISNGIITKEGGLEYICGVTKASNTFCISRLNGSCTLWTDEFCIPASEEAKKELFDKMAEAGYRWNAGTLELKKIEELEKTEPQFKEGDVVKDEINNLYLLKGVLDSDNCIQYYCELRNSDNKLNCNEGTITRINVKHLVSTSTVEKNKLLSALAREGYKYDKEQHKLIKQEFKPYDKVLVRDDFNAYWKTDIYLNYVENTYYRCTTGYYRLCIPYEGNEYLLGTTDSPTWTDKKE